MRGSTGVKREIEVEEAKRKALGAPRPACASFRKLLHGLEQDRKWQWSKDCQDATDEAVRSFCKGYFELKAEAARAGEADLLESKIARPQKRSAWLRGEGRRPRGRQSGGRAGEPSWFAADQGRARPDALPRRAGRDRRGARAVFRDGTHCGNDGGPIRPSRGVTVVEAGS